MACSSNSRRLDLLERNNLIFRMTSTTDKLHHNMLRWTVFTQIFVLQIRNLKDWIFHIQWMRNMKVVMVDRVHPKFSCIQFLKREVHFEHSSHYLVSYAGWTPDTNLQRELPWEGYNYYYNCYLGNTRWTWTTFLCVAKVMVWFD